MPGGDVTSNFNSEVLRPFLTFAVPGVIAGGPWYLLVQVYLSNHSTATSIVDASVYPFLLAAFVLFAGLLVEGIGSQIEGNVFDPLRERLSPGHMHEWRSFLLIDYGDSLPVGHRYLRNQVQILKSELNCGVAFLVALVAVPLLFAAYPTHTRLIAWGSAAALFLGVFLLIQAWSAHGLLSSTRRVILTGFAPKVVPAFHPGLAPARRGIVLLTIGWIALLFITTYISLRVIPPA